MANKRNPNAELWAQSMLNEPVELVRGKGPLRKIRDAVSGSSMGVKITSTAALAALVTWWTFGEPIVPKAKTTIKPGRTLEQVHMPSYAGVPAFVAELEKTGQTIEFVAPPAETAFQEVPPISQPSTGAVAGALLKSQGLADKMLADAIRGYNPKVNGGKEEYLAMVKSMVSVASAAQGLSDADKANLKQYIEQKVNSSALMGKTIDELGIN